MPVTEKPFDRIRQTAGRHPCFCRILTAMLLSLAIVTAGRSWSKFYTGSWDGYSELLAVGRITQLQQGQTAPGNFLGVYTDEWGDGQGYTLLKDNLPQNPAAYKSYVHQSGVQGTLEGLLARLLLYLPGISGETRLNILYFINCWLLYGLAVWLCTALGEHFGAETGIGAILAILGSCWLASGAKNLYWVLWTWLLPCCAGVLLTRRCCRKHRSDPWGLAAVFAAVCLRCLCGFEYVSSILILCELPLAVYWLERKKERRLWLVRMMHTGLAAVGGAATALLCWLVQCAAYYGSFSRAWQEVTATALSRAGGAAVEGDEVSELSVTAVQVLSRFILDENPQLQYGALQLPVLPILLLGVILTVGCGVLALRGPAGSRPLGLCGLWLLGFMAPVSWMLLSKGHAYLHTHLTPMLWCFAMVPCTGALAGWWCLRAVRIFTGRSRSKAGKT